MSEDNSSTSRTWIKTAYLVSGILAFWLIFTLTYSVINELKADRAFDPFITPGELQNIVQEGQEGEEGQEITP
jgi:hypothetical protein